MRYEIIFAPMAEEDLFALRAVDRAKVIDAIEVHLRYEPTRESKSRIKRLEGITAPQYRLRVDDLHAHYDVIYEMGAGRVEILAILRKADSIEWLRAQREKEDDSGTTEPGEG